jgi:tetratricopeptide (TPR) repeat protein
MSLRLADAKFDLEVKMKKGLIFIFFAAITLAVSAQNGTGDIDKIIAEYTQVLGLNPDNVSAYNSRGNAYLRKGELDLAISDFDQAISINPNYAPAYNGRGTAHYYKKDYDSARTDWTKALQLAPENPIVRYNLERLRDK